jgi:hypothetical protein
MGWLEIQLRQRNALIRVLQAPRTPDAAHATESALDCHQGTSVAGVVDEDLVKPQQDPRRAFWRFW